MSSITYAVGPLTSFVVVPSGAICQTPSRAATRIAAPASGGGTVVTPDDVDAGAKVVVGRGGTDAVVTVGVVVGRDVSVPAGSALPQLVTTSRAAVRSAILRLTAVTSKSSRLFQPGGPSHEVLVANYLAGIPIDPFLSHPFDTVQFIASQRDAP